MAATRLCSLIGHIAKLSGDPCEPHGTDRQLLDDFLVRRDETAFAELVGRHGPMVLRVCRRVLHHEQDAEDAFQATFLVLARNLGSIRKREALSNWLHGVAYRTAMKAQRTAARRHNHEARLRERTPPAAACPTWDDVQAVLDEEIQRLPEVYRAAFVLCVLEGKTVRQAAVESGSKERTLSSRLARARQRLQQQLARRGIQLTALLAALYVAESVGKAAVPRALAQSAVRTGILVASGRTAAGLIPPHVAALATGVTRAMFMQKARIAAFVLLTVGLFVASAGVLTSVVARSPDHATPPTEGLPKPVETFGQRPWHGQETVPQQKETGPQQRETGPQQRETGPQQVSAVDDKEASAYGGQVLGPDGKPVAGAKLYALYYTPKVLPIPQRGASDKDGTFRFSVERKEFDRGASAQPWNEVIVVAVAEGYGLGVPTYQPGQPLARTEQTVRLAKDDTPITGRILDLQGKPVAGATVSVHDFFWPAKGDDLQDWLADLKEKKEGWSVIRKHLLGLDGLWMGRDVGRVLAPAVTDAEGRFTLHGIGKERVVALRVDGPTIASTDFWAMTCAGEKLEVAASRQGINDRKMTFHGAATGDHLLSPSRPIFGIVRDKDTGKPIPGAIVESYKFAGTNIGGRTHLRAVADKEGRYRLLGMPKGEGNQIRIAPPEGQPYLTVLAGVIDTPGLDPAAADVKLKRGVWITGKVNDKSTGKPVNALVRYVVLGDNPNSAAAPGVTFEDVQTLGDGSFRFVGLPGRAAVTAQSFSPGYLTDVGGDQIKGLRDTFQGFLFNIAAEINPEKEAESITCNLALDPGRSLTGTIVDPDGKPLAGVRVSGCHDIARWENLPEKTAEFTVLALNPAEPRLLQFLHAEKKLAGSLIVRGDEKEPLKVKLSPAGVLTGRFVTTEGRPLADLEIFPITLGPQVDPRDRPKPDVTFGSFPPGLRTDKDGKFRIEGLAPGLKYRVGILRAMYALLPDGEAGKGALVKSGETTDLGDVKIKLPD